MRIGAAAHVAGDMFTKESCPLLWPVDKTRHEIGTNLALVLATSEGLPT